MVEFWARFSMGSQPSLVKRVIWTNTILLVRCILLNLPPYSGMYKMG